MFRFILAMAAVMVAVSADVSFAQGSTSEVDSALSGAATNALLAVEGAAAPAEETTAMDQWINWCVQGGRTMIFLGALSILGLGCALERVCHLRLKRIVPEGFSAKIVALWRDDKIAEVREECSKSGSMLARVVETMLEHAGSNDYQEVKMFAEDKAGRELRLENRKSAMLATVATLSPLLGLFGTVVGLLGAFTTVAAVGEMGDPAILADDISKALITTVAGLAISMPALFVYNLIKNRLNLYAVILEEEVSDLVHNLFIKISR
jgi:biopolymer transport protein ExbB